MREIETGVAIFDRMYATVLDDLQEFHGRDFDPSLVTCELEKTNLSEISMSISYKGVPALWQTLDLMEDKWKMQYKRWCLIH